MQTQSKPKCQKLIHHEIPQKQSSNFRPQVLEKWSIRCSRMVSILSHIKHLRGRHGHMVVGFKTTCAISAITTKVVSSNPAHGEVYLIQCYVVKFVSGFLRRLRFPPPIKLTTMIQLKYNPIPTTMYIYCEVSIPKVSHNHVIFNIRVCLWSLFSSHVNRLIVIYMYFFNLE